jgi:GNAT superfamily N-acetyltransferase
LNPSIKLASYERAQRDDYLRLLRNAWGDAALSEDEFDWWFDRNPAGSLMSVARADGHVVGVAAHSLYRMVVDGERRLATFSVHATTDESARGQGVFPALERKHEQEAKERGAAVVLAFASKPTAPIFLGPLGWTEVGRLRIWARPLPVVLRPRVTVERVERFGHAGDAAAGWPNHVIRDAAYLNWRYADSPKGYRAFRSGDGYAVLGHKRHRGTPIALVADLVARDPRPLLRACLAETRAGSRALFALPAPEQRRAYLTLGFVPTPLALHFMGRPLAGALNPDLRAWRFTLGDTDFF